MNDTVHNENDTVFEPANVFDRYADTVYRLAFVRTKNKYDADDILQEVFLRYMKVYKNMKSDEHVKAMLIRITINCSNSLLSSPWKKRNEALDESLPTPETDTGTDTLNAVLNLPVKYRTVIHLHYYMGYSVEEISNITHTNPSTVKTRLSRARLTLKNTLKADDFDV